MKDFRIHQRAHHLITFLGASYLTFVFYAKSFIRVLLHYSEEQTPIHLLICLLGACILFAFFCAGLHALVSRRKALFYHNRTRGRLSPGVFTAVSAGIFLLYLFWLFSCYPGGFSPDTASQWEQAHSLQFNDHHPAFHTFFFVLLTAIWDNYTFMLIIQIAAFACAAGYLAATMHAWGLRLSLAAAICILFSIATPTRNLLLFFWKDTAMSIFFLFFLSHLFNIVLTNGEWLAKRRNRIASALLLACITLVRHNAVLYTAPLLVLMIVFLCRHRRACLRLAAMVLLLVIAVKGPLYSLCNVEKNQDTYLETTGLPMTILFSSYVYSPETMPEEAYQFLERFVDHETACELYELGNYNSVKWAWNMDYAEAEQKMEQTALSDFIQMTLKTIQGNTTLSVRSVLELTDMVWDPLGTQYYLMDPPGGIPARYVEIPNQLHYYAEVFFSLIDGVLDGHIFQKLTSQLGILILIMLLAWYVSLHHFRGWSSLMLVLPVMCYNFGTMLLLCGPDYRFFHFNCLAAYPLVILLLSTPREKANVPCKS